MAKATRKMRQSAQPDDDDSRREEPQATREGASTEGTTAPAATDAPVDPADASPEQLRRMLADANDRHLRAKADLENYRRRAQREFGEIRAYTKSITVQEFFTVFDHFQMAMAHADTTDDPSQVETMRQGMQMILTEFQKALESLGVQQLSAEGCEFDPEQHEAIAQEPSDTVPAGHIVRQWKCGYRIGDRLVRPATVVVSTGRAADDASDTDESD